MFDPFLVDDNLSSDELLQLIISYEFSAPIYHADGFGHVQEEIPPNNNLYSLSGLIKKIELKQLWPELTELLRQQSEAWLMDFSTELQKHSGQGALQCLVDLSDMFVTPEMKLNYLLNSHEWHWLVETLPLIDGVIEKLTTIEISLQAESAETERWDLQMVQQTLAQLMSFKAN